MQPCQAAALRARLDRIVRLANGTNIVAWCGWITAGVTFVLLMVHVLWR